MNDKARRRVYLTHIAGGHFIDPAVLRVLGRTLLSLPDYIYVLNILHGMGIHPRLDYLEADGPLGATKGFEDLAARLAWSLGELEMEELDRLRVWHDGAGGEIRFAPLRWAFISWEK
ncbi:MAG: hypothetical protein U0166_08120 [Acidobacteriota bacterium]